MPKLFSPALATILLLTIFPAGPCGLLAEEASPALPGYQPGGGITEESVGKILTWALDQYNVPGAAVAIVKEGEVFLAEGYGIRNADTGEPVTRDTVFQLASVSKTFTAAAFAASVDDGKLAWGQPAREVLPDFEMNTPYASKWVNGTDFLTHRSGLPGFFGDLFDHLGYPRADIIHRVRFIEPGYSFRDHPAYSNVGFFLAGEMVAHAENSSFEDAVQQSVLSPLGMQSTGKAETLLKKRPAENTAASHTEVDGTWKVVPPNLSQVFVAAGGLASTARDLSHYLQMLVDGGTFDGKTIIGEESLQHLFDPVIASEVGFSEFPPINENSGFDYSPGWGIFHYNGLKVLEKGGALDGVRTVVILVPEEKFGIAVLANMNLTALPEAVRAGILQQMFGRKGEADLQPEIYQRAEKLHDMIFGAMQPVEPDTSLTPSDIRAFPGSYTNDFYGVWAITSDPEDPQQLILTCGPASYRGTLTATGTDTLSVQWPILISGPETLTFQLKDGEPATSFDYEGYTFRRIGPAANP